MRDPGKPRRVKIARMPTLVQKAGIAIKEVKETVKTPLPKYAKISVTKRFFKAFIPQIPAAVIAGIKAGNFWLGFGLSALGAVGTAIDKAMREKNRIKKENRKE